MRRGENPTEVLQGIHEAVADINANAPAAGRPHPRRSTTAPTWWHNTLHTVSHTLLEGLVVVVTVLLLFLGSVRAALLTAITIPLSLLFAFVCMHFTGIPANLLSLGALDFGIIVDGTLVMVEHIVHTLQSASSGQATPRHASLRPFCDAALEVESPDLLLAADHHLRVHPAVHAGARRAPAVHARWPSRSAMRCSARMLLALTLIPVLATYLFREWLRRPGTTRCCAGSTTRYERVLRVTVRRARGSRWLAAPLVVAGGVRAGAASSAASSCRSWTKA